MINLLICLTKNAIFNLLQNKLLSPLKKVNQKARIQEFKSETRNTLHFLCSLYYFCMYIIGLSLQCAVGFTAHISCQVSLRPAGCGAAM